jgi:hypothetical protein
LTPGLPDGGGSAGAIVVTASLAPDVTTNKLYNEGGALTWDGTDLTTTSGVNGWFDDGSNFRCTVENGLITAIGASAGAGYNVV